MKDLTIFVNLYAELLAGLAQSQYEELIIVEILFIYCDLLYVNRRVESVMEK